MYFAGTALTLWNPTATDEVFGLEIGNFGVERFFFVPLTSKTNLAWTCSWQLIFIRPCQQV
jgi:hypothetical protein